MPSNADTPVRALGAAQLEQFIQDGFVRIDGAFPRELADQGRAILWRDTGCDPDDRTTWTQPVIRLGYYGQEPFRKAVNTPVLHAAFDQLVGKGRWRPRADLGSFPVRFPSPQDPGDAGWHVDASFPGENPEEKDNFLSWRVNVTSRGRALLMLFLFSDVGERDAPTRIRVGSHLDIARFLEPAGEAGMPLMALDGVGADRPQALAVGEAGTVFVSSLPGPCRAAALRFDATLHGAAAAASGRTVPARPRGRRILPGGDRNPARLARRPEVKQRPDAARNSTAGPGGVALATDIISRAKNPAA